MMTRAERPVVVHVSPTYFAPDSVIGGGERYAEELARAMSKHLPVRFVSFGRRGFRERIDDRYERVVLNNWTRSGLTPFSPGLFRELRGARVIHCYQLNTLPTFLSVAIGRWQRSATYVSDLGGGGWTPGYQIDLGRWLSGHLPISAYAARRIPPGHVNAGVIYGGVDLDKFAPRTELRHDGSVVFLGRILPHKGIHTLIDTLAPDFRLQIIGTVGDANYLQSLRRRAEGRQVEFLHGLTDAEVANRLRGAAVLVHPTPVDANGEAGANELLGLAVLEAMASSCPVVVTRAASLPELVQDGKSGLVIEPNDPIALRAAVVRLMTDSVLWKAVALGARARIEERFTWSKTVKGCFRAYGIAP
jgi:glycosyltransferase involved in cell wall biosynthesis